MRKVYTILSFAAAAMVMSALPVLAEERAKGHDERSMQKDECLLVARLDVANCPNQANSLQDRIERLGREIAKGTVVYTPQELKSLRSERDQVQKIKNYMNNNEPSDSI
ncbi:hypothetical protein F6V25_12020 [Oryzomonas japonica]|uniref:Secreted protein n=1 Tax=Oryzomonas japonica TaxID=2603858 RepID=A0A7J4ZPG1_9BACT|nr:hypothetical protein [Oryzomonas japonica]KAB0664782.1 hypothetical protein F6V25_12020 [Oryzomonas japonica]